MTLSLSLQNSIRPGDRVRAVMKYTGGTVYEVTVTEVQIRFGTGVGNLIITDVPHRVGTVDTFVMFDASYVTDILSRSRLVQGQKINIYTDPTHLSWNHPRKGAPKGTLSLRHHTVTSLVEWAMGKLPYEIQFPVHPGRVETLWSKAGYPGLVSVPSAPSPKADEFFSSTMEWFAHAEKHPGLIREKQFRRFVQQNWSKLLMTRAEVDALEDASESDQQSQYWDDMENLEEELHHTQSDDWVGGEYDSYG